MRDYKGGRDAPKHSALARLILDSPLFRTSSFQAERNDILTEVQDELYRFVRAAGPASKAQKRYSQICSRCIEEDGGIGRNAAVRHFERKQTRAEKPFFAAEEALGEALTLQLIECVLQALHLAGVTDPELIPEICRVVLRGGGVFDGRGFGATPAEEGEQKAA